MKKSPIFLAMLMAFFICHNGSATAACPDPDSPIRPASHCTIHLLRSLFAKEISAEKARLRTGFEAVALYSVLKTLVMPHDKFLYVSCVLGISIGNGFRQGVVSDLVTTAEEQALMRGVIGDALGYVKPGFTLCKKSLHAPEITDSAAQNHVATINALANSTAKKLQTFSVLSPPAASPYKVNFQEMAQQEIATPGAYAMYAKVLEIGRDRSANTIVVRLEQLLQLLQFTSGFPYFAPALQGRILSHYEGLDSQKQQTWSATHIFGKHYSTPEKAKIYLDQEEKRKADEQERREQAARAMDEYQRDEAERRRDRAQRFKPNGYPKVVHRFLVDLSTIYSAVDMQSWMCSNGLSEASDSMRVVEKIGDLFKREEMGEEEFVKRTVAALLGRGKKNIRAFEGYRWNSLMGIIAGEAFGRIEGGLRFKESDMAEGSHMYDVGQHIQNLNSILEGVGVPATAVVARVAALPAPVIPAVGGDLSPEETALLQEARAKGWSSKQLAEEIAKRREDAALREAIIAARKA